MTVASGYDVLIVGGGLVGASLACALGGGTLKVGVIERAAAAPVSLTDYDLRVSAITLASHAMFANVGAWAGMERRRVSPIREMHVWDARGGGVIHFDAADIGEPYLGYIVENRVMVAALVERLSEFSNVELLCPAQVADIAIDAARASVALASGARLQASVLVAADGAQSRVREWAGIDSRAWSYRQKAIVATVATAKSHQATAWQVFMPTGPLAFLPLADGRSSIVWSADTRYADELLALDDAGFRRALGEAFGDTLGAIQAVGARTAFPLAAAHAGHYVQARLALVGDAAHRIHPLAGQGLNLGLQDAAVLAEVLMDARGGGRDVGALSVLRRYERWRKGENLATLAVMDAFKRAFGSDMTPVVGLRSAGFDLVDAMTPLKNLLMRHAVGVTGDLPRLARRVAR